MRMRGNTEDLVQTAPDPHRHLHQPRENITVDGKGGGVCNAQFGQTWLNSSFRRLAP